MPTTVYAREHGKKLFGFFHIVSDVWVSRGSRIFLVELHEDAGNPEPNYWAWEPSDKPGEFHMTQPSRSMLEVCFTYGSKAEVDRGRGRVVPVRAEVVRIIEKWAGGMKP
jgi:hypothetical protein